MADNLEGRRKFFVVLAGILSLTAFGIIKDADVITQIMILIMGYAGIQGYIDREKAKNGK